MTKREELLEEANNLGLNFAKNAKSEQIQKSINEQKAILADQAAYREAGGEVEDVPVPPTEAEIRAQLRIEFEQKLEDEKRKLSANMEINLASKSDDTAHNRVTMGQAKLKAKREASKLIRCNITSKDPAKASWEGEILSAGNDVVGDVKKYVMFNTDNGYHVPQILVNTMKDKKCTIFVNKKINGQMIKVGKQVGAYNIEILPDLTTEELTELGRDQIARGAIDAEAS